MSESQYLRQEIESFPDEPEYINDLRILKRFIQDGSFVIVNPMMLSSKD